MFLKFLTSLPSFAIFVEGFLNWLATETFASTPLVPLATSGDGNCLLHAASLAMWGFHDRELLLREMVLKILQGEPVGESTKFQSRSMATSICRRWRWQLNEHNQEAGELVLTSEQWESEWREVMKISSLIDHRAQAQLEKSPQGKSFLLFLKQVFCC